MLISILAMKQILQSHKTGRTEVVDLPVPAVKRGHVLIRTRLSLISSGTERMLVQASCKGLLQQAWEQPQRVLKAIDRVQSDGVLATLDSIKARGDQLQSLGYCNVGEVVETGEDAGDLQVGDRVVSNGAHAEFVCVPKNLCAKISADVSDEEAVFTVLGAIALQGVRLLNPTIGEKFVVMGLGSIGLLALQILRANGCRVLAMDFNRERLDEAARLGAEIVDLSGQQDPVRAGLDFSDGIGVDGVLITASTDSNEPLHQAASLCRRRGRIVLTGVIGPELSRADFYEKEISFQVSCSYGPGRYDATYEVAGIDYPLPYVRWTEQRNFEAFLGLIAENKITAQRFISHSFPVERAEEAYTLLRQSHSSLAIAITYAANAAQKNQRHVDLVPLASRLPVPPRQPTVAFVGAGNYGAGVLLPAFRKAGAPIKSVADRGGLLSWIAGNKNGAQEVTTDLTRAILDPAVNTVVIATRHDSHADFVCQALSAGKHVFVEKPLAINEAQLQKIETCHSQLSKAGPVPLLMVGFNRRFAPHVQKVSQSLRGRREPLAMMITVNAGAIPSAHWVHDPEAGGGRIVGEGCHFIDLMRFLACSPIERMEVQGLGHGPSTADKAAVLLRFSDGSMGTLNYLANGHGSYPKENIEIFCAGRVFRIENFIRLRTFGQKGFGSGRLWRQDKGQNACAAAFIEAVRTGCSSPIPTAELFEVTRATFQIKAQLK